MKRSRLLLLGVLALLALLGQEGRALAASSATIEIEVDIQADLSVNVDNAASSTDTINWNASNPNQAFASASTATVTNDSGFLTEKWGLSTLSASIDQGTSGSWSLVSTPGSVGADQFAVQAVFGSATTPVGGCPSAASGDWSNTFATPLAAGAPVTYTSTQFADTNLNNGGANSFKPDVSSGPHDGRMNAGSKRALCWRAVMPSSTSTIDKQTIQIIVTALAP